MRTVNVEKIDNLEDFVDSLEVDVMYMLPKTYDYRYVQIEKEKALFEDTADYCWVMEYNYKKIGVPGYVFPMSSGNIVKTFKTIRGCKKNLLKVLKNAQ